MSTIPNIRYLFCDDTEIVFSIIQNTFISEIVGIVPFVHREHLCSGKNLEQNMHLGTCNY